MSLTNVKLTNENKCVPPSNNTVENMKIKGAVEMCPRLQVSILCQIAYASTVTTQIATHFIVNKKVSKLKTENRCFSSLKNFM